MDERRIIGAKSLQFPDIRLVWNFDDLATEKLQSLVNEIIARDGESVRISTDILYKKAQESGQPAEVYYQVIVGEGYKREIWKSSFTIISRGRTTDSGEYNSDAWSTPTVDSDRESTSGSTGSGETNIETVNRILTKGFPVGTCQSARCVLHVDCGNPTWKRVERMV